MLRKFRTLFLILFIASLTCAVVWASLELAGQSNKSADDAGSSAADMEMASLDTIKPSTEKPGGANQETAIRGKIQKADKAYQGHLAKAKGEINSTGKVAPNTRKAGMSSAGRFKSANDEYAVYWDKKECASRAQLAREVGQSRVKSAEMAFNDVDSEKVEAYNQQQERVRVAQKNYIQDAKSDVSESDRKEIKSSATPRLKRASGDLSTLASTIMSLINQIQQQTGVGVGLGGLTTPSVSGCARQAATNPTSVPDKVDGIAGLLTPLKALLSLVQSMGSNSDEMLSDISSL